MTSGSAVSARERGRAGAREAGRLLGRAAGPSARAGAGARERADQLGRTAGEKENRPEFGFCFSFSKILNSDTIGLFH
jgi:hypothetical protein